MVTVPRPIIGSVGSRIRLVFGDNGNEWLLLLDHDNGDRQWQVKDWKGIPFAVSKQLNNCIAKDRDIRQVDFNSGGAWYINGVKKDGSGGHSWWGGTNESGTIKEWTNKPGTLQVSFGSTIFDGETHTLLQGRNGYSLSNPDGILNDLRDRMKRMNSSGKKINYIRLFHDNEFFISDDDGTEWSLANKYCRNELRKSGKVEEVAVAGDGCWVVVRGDKYIASTGVDKDLTEKLDKFFADQRRWANQRKEQIREARAEIERERLERERVAREAAEREERERRERAAREARAAEEARQAAERAERERREQEAREAVERANRERAEHDAVARISLLEAKLEERYLDEAKDIKEMEEKLQRRKRALLDSMPPEIRARSGLENNEAVDATSENTCVVCHDGMAVMAVVPCGHVCLCNACADACMSGQVETSSQSCPLCRGNMQSVLKIYL